MVSLLAGGSRQKATRMRTSSRVLKDSVVAHLTQGWLPVNPVVFKNISNTLKEQPDNREEILRLINQDTSLGLYLNAELYRVSGSAQLISPEQRILHVSSEQLQQVFPKNTLALSKHSLDKISLSQSGQLQRTIVATKAAAVLANKLAEKIADTQFGVMFSDLGRQLVAWNYPLVYNQALSKQRSGIAELDSEIERILGINPNQVSARLALRYGVPNDIVQAFNTRSEPPSSKQNVSLSDIIKYGRLFSERLDVKNFTESGEKFAQLEDQLIQKLGNVPDHKDIEAYAKETLAEYQGVVSKRSRLALGDWKSAELADVRYTLKGQHFQVPAIIRAQVQSIFERINEKNERILILSSLINTLIPMAGFSSGCIYVLSDDQQYLLPQMQIGRTLQRWNKRIALNSDSDLVRAFFSNTPVKQMTTASEEKRQFCYSAGIQCVNFDGVLVLSANVAETNNTEEAEQFNSFRTIHNLLQIIFEEEKD